MTDFIEIAPFYDRMTGFKKRLINDFGKIKNLVKKFEINSALDAGCGTGVHTIILSKLGIDVVGLDSSREMLEIARKNALNSGVEPHFEYEYFESMPVEWSDRFDAVFCLANSLAGVENSQRLKLALNSFHHVLKPGGHAIIQTPNFEKLRNEDNRIVKISTSENLTFVRFLDFEENDLRLNLLVIRHDMGEVSHQLSSEKILPINKDILNLAARSNKFEKIEFYSDLTLSDPADSDSPDIVAVLSK